MVLASALWLSDEAEIQSCFICAEVVQTVPLVFAAIVSSGGDGWGALRQRPWLQQSVFHRYRSETELMRIQRLVSKDLSLVQYDPVGELHDEAQRGGRTSPCELA